MPWVAVETLWLRHQNTVIAVFSITAERVHNVVSNKEAPAQLFSQVGEALLRAFGGNAKLLNGRYVKDLFKVGRREAM